MSRCSVIFYDIYCSINFELLKHVILFGFYASYHNFYSDVTCSYKNADADPEIFQRGGGEEENFERKMFVDTRINVCTHKN